MSGIDTSVVLSSRIRLARNVDGFNFAPKLENTREEKYLLNLATSFFKRCGDYDVIMVDTLSELEKTALIEQYVISKNLAQKSQSAVCIRRSLKNMYFSVMVNEEDHFREQCMAAGNNLYGAYNEIIKLDRLIQTNFRFAKRGNNFLTTCPSNYGSGMRASVMLFLPALSYTDKLQNIFDTAMQSSITIRGAFGEGSLSEGSLYQVSNSVTMREESEILERVSDFVLFVIGEEIQERNNLFEIYKDEFIDSCMRAYGVLTNCYLITYQECLSLIAKVKLGNSLGFLPLKDPQKLDDLIVAVRPATLRDQRKDDARDECLLRAEYVKQAFELI